MSEGYYGETKIQQRPQSETVETKEKPRKRILVVDDDIPMLKLTALRLRILGYEVVTAINGQDLLNKLESEDFGAVLTDIDMPEMDGLTALDKIKENPKYAPLHVIVHSAEWSDERKEKVGAWGGICLKKPYGEDELKITMDKTFEEPN